jgi:hypothetical protein
MINGGTPLFRSKNPVLGAGSEKMALPESESCLVLGFSNDIPIHAVCGWRRQKLSLITVYVLKPPKFIDPWTRGKKYGKEEM